MKFRKILLTALTFCLFVCGAVVIASCGKQPVAKTTAIIKYDVNTTYQTTVVKDKEVTIGKKAGRKPEPTILGDNPNNIQVYGWYKDKECTEAWDFKNDRVQGDMTLYAKWEELYEVNYYLNENLIDTQMVFKGDKIEEDVTVATGYKYLGSYKDLEHTQEFDYNEPISGQTDVYIARSEGIYLTDEGTDGLLSNLLIAGCGSVVADEEEGWVEEYTIKSTGEKCTYVNFGYNPTVGDGYVEVCLPLDITASQSIRLTYKNLGPATTICCYFTSMNEETGNYTETGSFYTQDFCYPNYTSSGLPMLSIPSKMSEDDEWVTVDFDLYEIYKNGYSIWGTSNFLGSIRIQPQYKNVDKDDYTNEFLIKSIEGIKQDIIVTDSEEISSYIEESKKTTEAELNQVSQSQQSNELGLVFPQDRSSVSKIGGVAEVINSKEGLLFYSENEIAARDKIDKTTSVTFTIPKDKKINLAEFTTFTLTVKNLGYATNLLVYVYNEEGVPVKVEFEIGERMVDSKTYTANLYGEFGMEGNLGKIEIRYNSVGVDNLLLIEKVGMSEFVPYDIVGINFNDKFTYGMRSTENVDVSFESDREGTLFDVKVSGASVTSPDKTYKATNDGYEYATLHYYLPKKSMISKVIAEFKINGKFTTPYIYELNTTDKGSGEVKLKLVKQERGIVEAVRFTFEGTGSVVVKMIEYECGETSIPLYKSYKNIYLSYADWISPNHYEYDSDLQASIFSKGENVAYLTASLYIGYTSNIGYLMTPHKTPNVLVTKNTKVKLVYQNKTDADHMSLNVGFDPELHGPSDARGEYLENHSLDIDYNMKDFEWSTLTLDIPEKYIDEYIGKISIAFGGKQMAIRVIAIENEVE